MFFDNKGSKWKLRNVQWYVFLYFFRATIGTVLGSSGLILLLSGAITEISPWQEKIERFLGFSFYSTAYFSLMALVVLSGALLSLFYTIYYGFPLGRYFKKSLQEIAYAADHITRGNLEYRLKVEGKDELSQVGKQFNAMADRIEDQVTSLQALVNENHVLVQQAEYAASLEERRKLARDLHDAVSQQLFAVSMTMAALPRLIDQQPDRAKQHLQQVEEMIIQAQQELRGLIMHLRPVTLEGHSLAVGLEQLLEELRVKNPDLQIQWEIDPIDTLEDGIEDQLFRVAQEAISNVLRHSKALEFKLILRAKPERVYFKLEDNGIGFSLQESRKASYGLQTMRERIEKIGGSLDILTYPGKGTKIDIRVPIQLGKGANHE